MAIEYNAIALSIAAIMFFLLEVGTRLNFNSTEKGFITLNEWTKIFFIICSFAVGLSLLIFAYGAVDANTEVLKNTVLTLIYAFTVVLFVLVCLIGAYILYFLPKTVDAMNEKNKGLL